MLRKLTKVLKAIDLLSEYSGKIFSFIIPLIVIIQTIEVIRRYFLNSPTNWAWELSILLYGAVFIIGGAWVLKEDRHVRTDVIYGLLSPKMKAYFNLFFFTVIFFTFAIVLTLKTIQGAISAWQIKETTWSVWGPPLYPLKIVIAVSFIMLLFQGFAKWIRDFIFVIKGEKI